MASVVEAFDDGSKSRPFGLCLIAGVAQAPPKVPKHISKDNFMTGQRVKPIVKSVNYKHNMPTRYQVPAEVQPATFATDLQMDSADGRIMTKTYVKKLLQERFTGVAQAAVKVAKRMSKENIMKRQLVKPFVKYVNYIHIMPTPCDGPAVRFPE